MDFKPRAGHDRKTHLPGKTRMPATDRPLLQLHATAGQTLVIVLDAQSAAGLLWRAPMAPPGCHLVADGQVAGGAGDGAAVQQRFLFTSTETGTHLLEFLLQRPWGDTPEAMQLVEVAVR